MKNVQYLAKDDHVSFGSTSYKALSEEKVTSIMRAELLKYNLVVFPIEQTASRVGNITHVDVKYRLLNVDNHDEFIDVVSCGDGADTQDKGPGKAMTYAYKYMWLRTFALPTGEDPDKISSAELDDLDKRREETLEKPGPRIPPEGDAPVKCDVCGLRFSDYFDGEELIKADTLAERSRRMYGRALCVKCAKKEQDNAPC